MVVITTNWIPDIAITTASTNDTTDFTVSSSNTDTIFINCMISWPQSFFDTLEDDAKRLLREFKERITSYRKALFKTKIYNNSLINVKINNRFNLKRILKRSWNGKESSYR